ncbi:MAG: lysophospholipid acyltransferase family protein [Actinomycetota bacterium]
MSGENGSEFGRAGVLQTIVRRVIGPLFRAGFKLDINGTEHLPDSGPAIIAANHTSVLDSFIVPAVLPRRVTYVGKAEYMDDWKTKHIFPALGMIPIDRSGGDAAKAALDLAARVLDDGEYFAIYPEGTRSRTGVLYKGRTGVARLALRTGAPIIPVGLKGMREIQPPDAPFPRFFKPATISFGEPLLPGEYGDPTDNPLVYRAMTDALMFRIRGLSGQAYENRYAPSAAELAEEASPVQERPDPVVEAPLAERRTASSLLTGAPLPSV